MSIRLLLCDCARTFSPDRDAIEKATGLTCSRVYSGLCTSQIEEAAKAIADPESEIIVACQQEADTFALLAEELEQDAPLCIDIRDRAGWSEDGKKVTPKIAALIAASQIKRAPSRTIDVASEGVCLIVGHSETVLPLAEQLAGILSVTCLLTDRPDILPGPVRGFDIAAGRLKTATGSLGGFKITVDDYCGLVPSGRGGLGFSEPRNGARSECDVIVDLTGNPPIFPAHEKRDGYLSRRSRRYPRGAARSFRRLAAGRHLRENTSRSRRRNALRSFPRRADRVHPVPGFLSYGGNRASRRCGRDRPAYLRRLRILFLALPVRRGHL